MTKELSGTEKTLDRYGRILEEVQRENIALWVRLLDACDVLGGEWGAEPRADDADRTRCWSFER